MPNQCNMEPGISNPDCSGFAGIHAAFVVTLGIMLIMLYEYWCCTRSCATKGSVRAICQNGCFLRSLLVSRFKLTLSGAEVLRSRNPLTVNPNRKQYACYQVLTQRRRILERCRGHILVKDYSLFLCAPSSKVLELYSRFYAVWINLQARNVVPPNTSKASLARPGIKNIHAPQLESGKRWP